MAAAISRHFSEVRRLINSNRRIATMWHRAEGPRRSSGCCMGPSMPMPPRPWRESPTGHTWGAASIYWPVYGSPRLRGSFSQRYRPLIVALLEVPRGARIEPMMMEGE